MVQPMFVRISMWSLVRDIIGDIHDIRDIVVTMLPLSEITAAMEGRMMAIWAVLVGMAGEETAVIVEATDK